MATLKKAAPKAKKTTAKAGSKAIVQKIAPKKPMAKGVPSKKAVPVKPVSKSKSAPVKKAPLPVKKAAPAKPAAKAKPIQKNSPAKKSAKPVAKVAAPKKMSTPEKKPAVVAKAAPASKAKPSPVKPVPAKPAPVKAAPAKVAPAPLAKKNVPQPVAESKAKPESKALPAAKDIKVAKPKPVVLPKITTTKSRKYEPDFTKSVLDKAAPEKNITSQRYSDGELNDFKELIQRKLEAAKKELGYLQGLITRKDEMGGDDTDNRYMTMEDGSLSMEREQLSQMASRQITFIDHLEKAMMRIENKTYGICRVTGKLIDKARLRAVPHATLSIEAKMGMK